MSAPKELQIGVELEEFPARSFNELVREWYRQRAQQASGGGGGNSGGFLPVLARNVTGQDLEYGDCVALEGLAVPFADKTIQAYNHPLLKAQKHTSSLHHAILGVALAGIADNGVGSFLITGPAWVRTNYTDEAHHFVKLKENQVSFTELCDSATSGYPILDSEEIPDPEYLPATLWALVLLGGGGSGGGEVNLQFGRVTTQIDPAIGWDEADAGTGSVELSSGTVEVKNRYFDLVVEDSPVWVFHDGETYWLINAGCTPGPPEGT